MTDEISFGDTVRVRVARDYAINVFFDGLGRSVWLSEELLTPVDHGVGTIVALDGGAKWVRRTDGGWTEHGSSRGVRRPWWRFWG